jgi:hypothetical protein
VIFNNNFLGKTVNFFSVASPFISTEPGKSAIEMIVVISMAVISIALCALVLDVLWNSFMHWFGFAGFTLFLFGQFVTKSRWAWRKRSFWNPQCFGCVENFRTFMRCAQLSLQFAQRSAYLETFFHRP